MDTIVMNSKNSKALDPPTLVLFHSPRVKNMLHYQISIFIISNTA